MQTSITAITVSAGSIDACRTIRAPIKAPLSIATTAPVRRAGRVASRPPRGDSTARPVIVIVRTVVVRSGTPSPRTAAFRAPIAVASSAMRMNRRAPWTGASSPIYTSGAERLHSDGFAVTTDRMDLDPAPAGWSPGDLIGRARVAAESTTGKPVFVGIAPTADVDRYLGHVARSEVTNVGNGPPSYESQPGHCPSGLPAAQGFWAAKSQGAGRQQLDWDAHGGVWSIVVMNADGSRAVTVDADAGAKVDWLIWVGIGLVGGGLLLGSAAGVGMYLVARRRPGAEVAEGPEGR